MSQSGIGFRNVRCTEYIEVCCWEAMWSGCAERVVSKEPDNLGSNLSSRVALGKP